MLSDNDQNFLKQVRKWAGAMTDALLDPKTLAFFLPDREGFIGYRIEDHVALVIGEPVCAEDDKRIFAKTFHKKMEDEGKSVIFIGVSEKFSDWAIENICKISVEIGMELEFSPVIDPRKATGEHASLIRRKAKQAARDGISIHEYSEENASIEDAIVKLSKEWLLARSGLQVHISDVYLFSNKQGKRWFYAKKQDEIIGVLTLNQLEAKKGYLLNHIMIKKVAPHGVSELLISSVFETLEKENCSFITSGIIGIKKIKQIKGMNKLYAWFIKLIYLAINKIAKLDKLNGFWEKFNPQERPTFLLFNKPWLGLSEMKALKTFLHGNVIPK